MSTKNQHLSKSIKIKAFAWQTTVLTHEGLFVIRIIMSLASDDSGQHLQAKLNKHTSGTTSLLTNPFEMTCKQNLRSTWAWDFQRHAIGRRHICCPRLPIALKAGTSGKFKQRSAQKHSNFKTKKVLLLGCPASQQVLVVPVLTLALVLGKVANFPALFVPFLAATVSIILQKA